MGKAGGIIGLLAGLFGTGAAIVTLFFGGLFGALGASEAESVIGLGWGGVLFSFLVIVFGVVAIFKHAVGGYGLIVSSILGAILGGTLVAICMALSLIGGILSVVASRRQPAAAVPGNEYQPVDVSINKKKKSPLIWIVASVIIALIAGVAIIGGVNKDKVATSKQDPLAELAAAQPAELDPYGKLSDIFAFGSDYTDLQRENTLKEIKGKVVQWTLPVYEIKKKGDNSYRIQTNSDRKFGGSGKNILGTFITLTVRNEEERKTIEALKTNDSIKFKGIIQGVSMRSLDIEPAILVSDKQPEPAPQKEASQQGSVGIDPRLYLGKHPTEMLKQPQMRQWVIEQVGKEDFELLYTNLQGTSVLKEVEGADDMWYYADSMTQRAGKPEGAAFMINANNGYVFGVIRTNNAQGGILKLVGVQSPKELQTALYKWYKEQGGQD